MITEDAIVDATFLREGDAYGDQHSTPPIDQPTGRGGIILETLRRYVTATGSSLAVSVATLKALTREQARAIVRWELRQIAKAHKLDAITFEPLRLQLLDFAYNSGAERAIRWLQRVLRVPSPRNGRMDDRTIVRLEGSDLWLVHQALIGARLQMIDMATDPGGSVNRLFEEGLENRAFTFSLLEIP